MSRNKDHDPEDRSSSEWLDGMFKQGGPLPDPQPEWVNPDEVTPDDDGNVTVTMAVTMAMVAPKEMPEAPQGVVVHLTDGSSRTAEVVWVGTGLTGIEMWEVTARYRFDEIKRITIEELPANSEVHIGGTGGPSAEG